MVSSEPAEPLGARQHRVRAGTISSRVFTGAAQPALLADRQKTTASGSERINIAAL